MLDRYSTTITTLDSKILTTYLMLTSRQRVDYDILFSKFGISKRHFERLMATIRDSLEMANIQGQLVYNKINKTYELVKVHLY